MKNAVWINIKKNKYAIKKITIKPMMKKDKDIKNRLNKHNQDGKKKIKDNV